MNCSHARALLATYREQEQDQADPALDAHLKSCVACREAYVRMQFVGAGIRALPSIEPALGAHASLMQALAAEHVRFMQCTPSSAATSTPTPVFLAPYLKDLAQKTAHTDAFAAFSTAETGPLPVLRPIRPKHRSIYQMNHLTILGMAAAFLMVLMVSGLTSLLLLANSANQGTTASQTNNNDSVTASQVKLVSYAVPAIYTHVASAQADGTDIYYTAYNNNATSWTLAKYNSVTNTSTPLLPTASSGPIIILGSTANWLAWLQTNTVKATTTTKGSSATTKDRATTTTRASSAIAKSQSSGASALTAWSLHIAFIGTTTKTVSAATATDVQLYSNTFHTDNVPSWVRTPIQGIAFTQNKLLVAFIDSKGISHLWSYALDASTVTVSSTPTRLASANNGHILAFPTTNGDGSDIYWSEEWWSSDQQALQSDIWTQQTQTAQPDKTGRWAVHTVTSTYLYRADEHSFHPQVVQDMLFLLDTSTTKSNSAGTTPGPTTTVQLDTTATPAAVTVASALGGSVPVDPTVYAPQIDTQVTGKLLAFIANGTLQLTSPEDSSVQVSALLGGSRFLIWQEDSANNFKMYDVVARAPVTIGDNIVPKDAAFLSVDGNTAVWVENPLNGTNQNTQANGTINFGTFNWPVPLRSSSGP